MRLADKQKIIAAVAIFALLLLGEAAFGYYVGDAIAKNRGRMNDLEKERAEAQRKIQEIPALQKKSEELANIIEQYAEILPNEKEVTADAFVGDIGNFAQDSDVMVVEAMPEKVTEPKQKTDRKKGQTTKEVKTFVRHKYRFKLEGTFLGFVRFINKIENHPRFLRVDEIKIEAVGQTKSSKDKEDVSAAENPVKSIELVISTYTYSKETPAPAVEEASK